MLNRNLMRLSVLLSVLTMSAWSCEKSDSNGPRKEYIEVYLSKDAEEPVTSLSVPCAGGEFKLYVKTDVDFKSDWQDEIASPWVEVANVEKDGDWSVINLNIQPISEKCYYTRRTGTLMLRFRKWTSAATRAKRWSS